MVTAPVSLEDAALAVECVRPELMSLHMHFEGEHPDVIALKVLSGDYFVHCFDVGFCVVDYDHENAHVVAASAFSGSVKSCISDYILAIAEYATTIGCSTMSFTSPRRAWNKIAPSLGFVAEDGCFTKELCRV